MKSEPTTIIEFIRAAALLLSLFGIVTLSVEDQVILAGGVAALALLASGALAWWNRRSVYSPETTQKIADRAKATGNTDIGEPPTGPA